MPLNRYRVFSRIAETGNMRKAANEMMYTQQAISRIVKCMEEDYGFSLFIRERDGVSLTPEAEKILPAVNELLNYEDKVLSIIKDVRANEGLLKHVHIGACGSIVMNIMNRTLELLDYEHPEITVGVHYNANDRKTIEMLKSGKLDCALMVEGCQGDMEFEPLFREKFIAAIPRNHKLAKKESISIEELNKYHNVITPDNPYYDEIMGNGNHNAEVVDEEIMMLPIISSGNAVGIMSGLFNFDLYKDIVIRPLDQHYFRTLGIATKPGDTISKPAQVLIETLRSVARG